jgi:hypothetical protein
MSKYLNREQVLAYFRLNVLPKIKAEDGDRSLIEHAWDITLEMFLTSKKISENQKDKWKLKDGDLI